MDTARRRFLLIAALVGVLALLAHGAGLQGGFVFDDHRFIEHNPALASVDVGAYFRDPSTASASEGIQHDIYRPLRTLLFALQWQLFGASPAGWHAVSLLLHVLASVLVLRLLWPLVRGAALAAGAGAAIFAVHPAGVECVAWVSSQGDLLALVLGLAALIVLEKPGVLRTALGLGLVALACFAKESALVLPALLLLRDLALPRDEHAPSRLTTWVRVGLLTVVVVAYLALRLSVIPDMAQVSEFPGGSRAAATRGMLAGLAWYARALLWPTGFPFDLHLPVPHHATDPSVVVGTGLLLTLLAAGIWGMATKRGLLAFATLGALACLVPVSNVLVPLKAVVAERFLYPVLVCLAAGVALAVVSIPLRRRTWALPVVGIAVVACIVLSWQRTKAWADDLVLWETVLQARPTHARAYEGLGFEYLRRGRIREAEIAYRSYLEYNPADGKAMRLVGDAFGDVARSLRLPGQTEFEFATGEGRRRARIAQMSFYARAIQIWGQGLVRGRGSPEMLRETYDRLMEAAWDLGDVLKAKEANDVLLRMEGVDPTDVEAVFRDGSFHRRRMRVDLAWRVLTTPTPRDLKGELYEKRMAQRATVLRDVGIRPSLPDARAAERLVPRMKALIDEAARAASDGVAGADELDVILTLRLGELFRRHGRGGEARRLIEEARRRRPGHPLLRGGR